MRRYGRRKQFRRKRTFRRRGRGSGGLVRAIKRVMWRNAETKFYLNNYAAGSAIPALGGSWSWFDGLTAGTGPTNRIGTKIHAKNISAKITFSLPPGNLVDRVKFRVLIVYPRKSVNTATLLASLTSVSPGLYGRPDPTLMYVIMDKFYELQAPDDASGGRPSTIRMKIFRKTRYIMNYDFATNNIAREPLLWWITDTDQFPLVDGYLNMSFKDF